MRIHPGGFRLCLAGSKVARLAPFLEAHGFTQVEALPLGRELLPRLRAAPCHLLLLEVEVGEAMGVDIARTAKAEQLAGGVLLLDDPIKAGMIISALVRGVDGFIPVPPDEAQFLHTLETHLLAQFGLAQGQHVAALTAQVQAAQQEVDTLRAELASERQRHADALARDNTRRIDEVDKERRSGDDARKAVAKLEDEVKLLRDQLASMHLVTGARSGMSGEGAPVDAPPRAATSVAAGATKTPPSSGKPAATASPAAPSGAAAQARASTTTGKASAGASAGSAPARAPTASAGMTSPPRAGRIDDDDEEGDGYDAPTLALPRSAVVEAKATLSARTMPTMRPPATEVSRPPPQALDEEADGFSDGESTNPGGIALSHSALGAAVKKTAPAAALDDELLSDLARLEAEFDAAIDTADPTNVAPPPSAAKRTPRPVSVGGASAVGAAGTRPAATTATKPASGVSNAPSASSAPRKTDVGAATRISPPPRQPASGVGPASALEDDVLFLDDD